MKTQIERPSINSRRLLLALGFFLAAASLQAATVEMAQNGSFDGGLAGWKVTAKIPNWNPVATESGNGNAYADLHPLTSGYSGNIIYQNLNVTGVSGKTLTVSMRVQKMYSPPNVSTLAVYVDYKTTGGQFLRVKLLNPNNDGLTSGAWASTNGSVTLPGNAAKVVRLLINKEADGQLWVDDISLTAADVTVLPLPVITGIFPVSAPYLSPITISGANLGTNGMCFIGQAPVDLVNGGGLFGNCNVATWQSNKVLASTQEPDRNGIIYLVADGVEASGSFYHTITSPNFIVDLKDTVINAIRGDRVKLMLRVTFLNGFHSTNGVRFMVTTPPGLDTALSSPLTRSGGYAIQLDTSSLTNGSYSGMVQSLEDHSYARFVPFTLNVLSVTNINFLSSGYPQVSITNLTVTNQVQFYFSYQLIQNDGSIFGQVSFGPPPQAALNVVSSNPDVVQVSTDNMGFYVYHAVGNGSANLTFTTVNGFSKVLPVTVNFPVSPSISSANQSPGIVDNSGNSTNFFFWQGNGGTPNGVVVMGGGPTDNFIGVQTDFNAQSKTWSLHIPAGSDPGTYTYIAYINSEYSAARPLLMTVVNAASRGEISGNIMTAVTVGYMQEISGSLEIYDNTNVPVKTNMIWSMNGAYRASYLAPGTYRLRFVPDMSYGPVWYPNGSSFAEAQPISVVAGQTVSNINFCLAPSMAAPINFAMAPPGFAGSPTNISIGVTGVAGVEYTLQYKNSLSDATWTDLPPTITGDGSPIMLCDPTPDAKTRMYRIKMLGQ